MLDTRKELHVASRALVIEVVVWVPLSQVLSAEVAEVGYKEYSKSSINTRH